MYFTLCVVTLIFRGVCVPVTMKGALRVISVPYSLGQHVHALFGVVLYPLKSGGCILDDLAIIYIVGL